MGQSAQKQDMLSVPSGGIADFYMSDEDIAIIEQEEAQKAFGSEERFDIAKDFSQQRPEGL